MNEPKDPEAAEPDQTTEPEAVASAAICSPSWRVGDWCFFEYKLAMVKAVADDGRVTDVSDGWFNMGSWDLRDLMFALDLRGKCVSEEFAGQYDKLRKESGEVSLNWPDIHQWFVAKWAECMERCLDDAAVKAAYEELNQFVRGALDLVEAQKQLTVMGVRLMR